MAAEASGGQPEEVNLDRILLIAELGDAYRDSPCITMETTDNGLVAVLGGFVPSDRAKEADISWHISVVNRFTDGNSFFDVSIWWDDAKPPYAPRTLVASYNADYPARSDALQSKDRRMYELLKKATFNEDGATLAADHLVRTPVNQELTVEPITETDGDLRYLSDVMRVEHMETQDNSIAGIAMRGVRRIFPFLRRKSKND